MSYLSAYYWLSFAVSFVLALMLPTKLSPRANVIGSFLFAMFGFVLWPLAALAVAKHSAKNGERASVEGDVR